MKAKTPKKKLCESRINFNLNIIPLLKLRKSQSNFKTILNNTI